MDYKLSTIVEKENKWYVAHCVELQITSQGENVEEALKNLKDAIGLYLRHVNKEEVEMALKDYKTGKTFSFKDIIR
ncbi:MAG: type II toxin-antitoxin system HicB family antitoxin [Candidatus Micrarchaeota archaeon]